jgi:Lanthionine synthetase C-like protein
MIALLRGWDWLSDDQRTRLRQAVPATLTANALRGEMGVNWPAVVSDDPVPTLTQHCHGAAGMVTALADEHVADAALTSLLTEGAGFVWRAGPLAKGSNLCHGTGGNGFAFLKLHQLTGEPIWLSRAHAFAMSSIDQCRAARAEHGRGRYSLWTGDIGLACYLHECLAGSARFPSVDVF